MDEALSNSVSETEDDEGLDTEDEYSDDESSFRTRKSLLHIMMIHSTPPQSWANV
jgi:hypothetical protein